MTAALHKVALALGDSWQLSSLLSRTRKTYTNLALRYLPHQSG